MAEKTSITNPDGSVSTRTVDADGFVVYRDTRGRMHRDGGPAFTTPEGHEIWYLHGRYHRMGGPAITHPDGYQSWCQRGRFHRLDGPAVTYSDGRTEWWVRGHRRYDLERSNAEQKAANND